MLKDIEEEYGGRGECNCATCDQETLDRQGQRN